MAKFQSPLLGYNNNVRHKNRVFHIQTEDSGVGHPHIITHLFMDGGRILKSVKTSYAEHVGTEGMKETVRGMMKEQHKAMFIALRDGQYDHIVDPGAAAAAAAAAAAPAAAPAASADAPAAKPSAAPPAKASAPPPANEAIVSAVEPVVPAAVPPAAPTEPEVLAGAPSPSAAPATSPDPPRVERVEIEASPNTIDESKRPAAEPAAAAASPRIVLAEPAPEDVPTTTRQPAEARPDAIAAASTATATTAAAATAARPAAAKSASSALDAAKPPATSPSGRELTLDFDALERAAQDPPAPTAASLFKSADLPPPPKNTFASKEPGSGGVYRALDPNNRVDPREERVDPREEPVVRSPARGQPAVRREESSPPPPRSAPRSSPANRPPSDARYAPARPAAIFGNTQRPQPASLFSDEFVSDKSLDEVILSYLAEDLEPPRRK